MKKTISTILTLIMLLTVTGCNKPVPSENESELVESQTKISFTDDLNRNVTVESPKRVAVMIGSFADIWCLAGGKDSIVAAANDTWTQFDLGLSEKVVDLGAVKAPDVEALLASEPDFVIASAKGSAGKELEPMLTDMEIPVAYFDISSFSDYLRMLDICTKITGQPENYELYGTNLQSEIDNAKAMIHGEAPSVLYIRASGSICKIKNSENTVLGEMLKDLGTENIADSETGLLEDLSMETIIASDPDFIFVVLQGSDLDKCKESLETSLTSNPAWNGLTAVKEGRLFFLDQQLYNLKPNARWGEAYESLAEILYGKTK